MNKTIDGKLAKKEANEIARVMNEPQKLHNYRNNNNNHGSGSFNNQSTSRNKNVTSAVKNISNSRPLTPKEQMKLRKRQKADEEAERLKKITVCAYNESRRQCSDIKERQTKKRSFVSDDVYNNGDDNDDVFKDDEHQDNDRVSDGFYDNKNIGRDVDKNTEVLLKTEHLDVCISNYDGDDEIRDFPQGSGDAIRRYTHCFGEGDDETQANVRKYTHCFGIDSSDESDDQEEKQSQSEKEEIDETELQKDEEEKVFEEPLHSIGTIRLRLLTSPVHYWLNHNRQIPLYTLRKGGVC